MGTWHLKNMLKLRVARFLGFRAQQTYLLSFLAMFSLDTSCKRSSFGQHVLSKSLHCGWVWSSGGRVPVLKWI